MKNENNCRIKDATIFNDVFDYMKNNVAKIIVNNFAVKYKG